MRRGLRWVPALLLALQGGAFAQDLPPAAVPSAGAASAATFAQLPQLPDLPQLPELHPLTQPLMAGESDAAPEVGRGLASWYGPRFHGRRTASGERFDMHALTAAHPTLPFGSIVRVENVETGRSVDVRINDRGPRIKQRIIDLSRAAARALGLLDGNATPPVVLKLLKQPD